MKLQFAKLFYGTTAYDVTPNDTLPLPTEFDFNDPINCAKKIFAIMSNASGGHPLRECKLRYDANLGIANLTSSGCHVFYDTPNRPKRTVEELIKSHADQTFEWLGTVVTDQYGDGWKFAQWKLDGEKVLAI